MKRKIIIISIVFLMLQNASASVWVDDVEIGLSPYQLSGYVNNNYIIRADFSNINNIYIESTSIEILYYADGHQKVKVNGYEFYIYDKNIKIDMGWR